MAMLKTTRADAPGFCQKASRQQEKGKGMEANMTEQLMVAGPRPMVTPMAPAGTLWVESSTREIASIRAALAKSARRAREFGGQSEPISQILEAIDEITEQINLLALSIAVGAARAGAQDKELAVVLDEVQDLAGHSSRCTDEMIQRIRVLQQRRSRALRTMEAGAKEVEQAVRLMDSAARKLIEIETIVKTITYQVERLSREARALEQVQLDPGHPTISPILAFQS